MKFYLRPLLFMGNFMAVVHPGFVSLSDLCPEIRIQANYSTKDNFTGGVVPGYKAAKSYLALAPAKALCKVQKEAQKMDLTIKVFDGYRPVKAVAYFQEWAKKEEDNLRVKELFYPRYTRLELFEMGFIAKRSTHSRGSAIDLTLSDPKTGLDLDMGSEFDYFDDISHTESPLITHDQLRNRMLLRDLMQSEGFKNYSGEWWHFSYRPEPYPETFFDFDIE